MSFSIDYLNFEIKIAASFECGNLFILRVERDLCFVGASKPQYHFLTTYEHGIRVYVRGGVCVVGEFVLAYLYHFSKITPLVQVLGLIFFKIVTLYVKLIP
jgi:hypothetical protein